MNNLKKKDKSNILNKITIYNNNKNIEINKKIDIKKNYNINFDEKRKNIIIISDDKNKKLVGNYIFFGIYQPDTKLWIWSSSIPGVNKNQIKFINDLRNKKFIFENDDNIDTIFIYQLLSNDVIYIDNKNMFNLINKTLNFLVDGIFVFNPINNTNNIQFIGLTNIIEEYV